MALAETLKADHPSALERAAEVIRAGGVVAVPTETFYGLAADAGHPAARARIFEIKGRPADMALPLVAASLEQVIALLGPMDAVTAKAAQAFWPGPLSLVLNATPLHSGTVEQTDNRLPATDNRSVAVRVPAHDFVRALCDRAGVLLTSTSANRTGEPPAETADAVVAGLGDAVDLVIDGGRTPGGKPSSIVDLRGGEPVLVRDGAVEWSRVLESLK
ncbi:MAG TPA: L-threonylcarbamoyladenylate synthase [Vicinamibacterales bacterium]|nr:L-threonylcarbamoyladenylate synthase [Vicinamibacterales bacterium]